MDNPRMQQIRTMLEKEPEDPFLNYALAIEYVGMEMNQEAIAVFEKIYRNHPDYTPTYYHLAQAYLRKGEKNRALGIMQEGMAVASRKQEKHTLSELQSAYNEIVFEDYD